VSSTARGLVVCPCQAAEEVFLPGRVTAFGERTSSWAGSLLRAWRDEAILCGRFHRQQRGGADERSGPLGHPGLGPKAGEELLGSFRSIDASAGQFASRSLRDRVSVGLGARCGVTSSVNLEQAAGS